MYIVGEQVIVGSLKNTKNVPIVVAIVITFSFYYQSAVFSLDYFCTYRNIL